MAYLDPGATHADDWDAPVAGGNGAFGSQSKVAHTNPPLTTNQLTHGRYNSIARLFTDSLASERYGLKTGTPTNPNFIGDSAAQAISMVGRIDTSPAWAGITVFLRWNNSSTAFYCLHYDFVNGLLNICGNSATGTSGETWHLNNTGGAGATGMQRHALISVPATVGDWAGIRFIALTEGSDVRLKGYLCRGAANLNNIDPTTGEPPWGSPVLEIGHINGNTTPVDYLGGATLGTFGNPNTNLSGDPGWAVAVRDGSSRTLYVDAPRIKRVS